MDSAPTPLPTTRIGRGGWVRLLLPEPDTPAAYLRFQAAETGRLDLHDVFLGGGERRLDLSLLRRLEERLGRLEVWANSPQIRPQILERLDDPGPQPGLDLAWFELDVHAEPRPAEVAGTWVEASRLAQAGHEPDAKPKRDAELEDRQASAMASGGELSIPTSRPFPDEFYAQVAELYRRASVETSKPVTLIAKAHAVKASTVHGWVAKARQRGFLESPGQGRIG